MCHTDVRMPGLSGIDLLKRSRELNLKSALLSLDFVGCHVTALSATRSPVLATSANSALTSVVLPVEVPPATRTAYREIDGSDASFTSIANDLLTGRSRAA
jgi:CheY-like chemotaxis protein